MFVASFLFFLTISLVYSAFTPGRQIYYAVVGLKSDYSADELPVASLAIGVFNRIIWGTIIHMAFGVLESYVFKQTPTTIGKSQTE